MGSPQSSTTIRYRIATEKQAEEIAKLAICLTNEISEKTGIRQFDLNAQRVIDLCKTYLSHGLYSVMAAYKKDQIVGFGTLCESHSLYAEGPFGIVQEFYVVPQYRSQKIGKGLIEAIVEFAKQRGWRRLELCTPPIPEFERTVAFYHANGFQISGGYKMKCSIA